MRKKAVRVILGLGLVLMAWGVSDVGREIVPAPHAYAQDNSQLMAVGNVRLRTEPSASAQQIGLIGWGTVVRLLEVDASGQWYRVEADGVVGWSLAGWFEAYQGEATVSSSPSSGQTDTPNTGASSSQTLSNSNGTGTVRAVGTIRIRQAPHTNSAILGQMAWGDQALLLGMDASRYWAQVNFDGVVGWVNVGWLEITPGEVRVPISSQTTSAPSEANVPSVSQQAVSQSATGDLMAVGNVRLRAAANAYSAVLASIGWGERVSLLGTDASGEWYQVSYQGSVGWAHAGWFQVVAGTGVSHSTDNPALSGGVESTSTVAVVSSVQGNIVRAVGNVRVRNQPSVNGAQVGAMGWGDAAQLLGTDASREWYQIEFNGVTGWVYAAWMEIAAGELPNMPQNSPTVPVTGEYLIIPSLGISSALFEMELVTTDKGRVWYLDPWEPAVGHLQGTARPGQAGNIVLGAHSEYPNGAAGIFGNLNRLNIGNTILLYTNGVGREYRVVGKTTVAFDDLHVVYPTQYDRLTLLTCTNYSAARGIYLSRLIIYAEPVDPN